jgi:hypothetical protein
LRREHGVQCRFHDNTTIEDYLVAISSIVSPDIIIAASKCDRLAKVFFNSMECVDLVTAHGLEVNGHFMDVHQIEKPITELILSGVSPFLPNESNESLVKFAKISCFDKKTSQHFFSSITIQMEGPAIKFHIRSLAPAATWLFFQPSLLSKSVSLNQLSLSF